MYNIKRSLWPHRPTKQNSFFHMGLSMKSLFALLMVGAVLGGLESYVVYKHDQARVVAAQKEGPKAEETVRVRSLLYNWKEGCYLEQGGDILILEVRGGWVRGEYHAPQSTPARGRCSTGARVELDLVHFEFNTFEQIWVTR